MQTRTRSLMVLGLMATLILHPGGAAAGTVILKKAWVEKFANLTKIEVAMKVHHAHARPNRIGKGSEDGDLHFAGTSPKGVGLPFVAEIVNAKAQNEALAAVHDAEEGDAITVGGAWRIWFEHPAKKQTQGGKNAFAPDNTNPDHLFEIHPISLVGDVDIARPSFVPIPKFTAYDGETAFPYFDSLQVTVQATKSAITLESKKSKYNYVDFYIELTGKPKKVADGYIALANVVDAKGESVADGPRRMVFVEGTDGADKIKSLGGGDTLHVLGIPRFNLDAIMRLVKKNGTTQFEAQLPYEMIIVGIYRK